MNSFKDIAYQILKEAGKPLHSKEITKIALQKRWLKTAGKTPEATIKSISIADSYLMALIFCFFDTEEGDLWDYLWFVPAPGFH